MWHNADEDPRIEAWCPGRCPPHRPINSDDIVARLKGSGGNVTWDSSYDEGSEPTRCDPCRHRWLFVASLGGRTGSTTVLDMLDQHPAVSLSGENGGQLLTAMTLWDQAARQDFTAGPWVRGKPNVANMICDLQSWFLDAGPAKVNKGPDAIRGFKEVRFGPVDDNGLCFNYQIAKQKLKVLCDSMDEYTLMPSLSPHLSIEEQEQHYLVEFNREKMYFLKPDVLLIPVRNISVEELAYYILETLKHDGFVDSLGITYLEIKVSSGPGLWGSSNWTKA